MIEKRAFGSTGHDVSVLGFGGAPVGYLETAQQEVEKVLNTLLDRGVNLIDTAAGYAGSEEAIGKAIGHRRGEHVLVSKCGRAFADVPGDAWSAQVIEGTIDRALKRLRTDCIDVMLLHSCDLDVLEKGEAVGALVKARDAGKIRFAGYSGDNEAAAFAANLEDVAVIETSVSICDQANIDLLLPETKRRNIGVLAKRPIANAAWRAAAEQRGQYVDYAKIYSQRLRQMAISLADLGFEGEPATLWPEVALRFTLSVPGVATAIVGTTTASHVERNLAAAEKGALTPGARQLLRDAFRRAEANSGERWIGLQ